MTYCRRALWLVLGLGVAGWSTASQGAVIMSDTFSTPPVCTGRFIVHLPADAKEKLSAIYHYIEVQPAVSATSFDDIENRLDARAKKLSEHEMIRDARSDAIFRSGGVDPNKLYTENQLVGFRVDDSIKQAVIAYHSNLKSPQVSTEVHRFFDGLDHIFQSDDAGADKYPVTRDAMWSAAKDFQPLSRHTQPDEPGFCVEGGMFVDDGRPPVQESFTLVVSFKAHPDAEFSIDANTISSVDKHEPSLKFRVDSELRILRENVDGHVDVLVRGDLEVAGQKGYQIGLRVLNAAADTTVYKFFWAADGVPNDATRPHMEVDLTIQPDDGKPATIKTADEAQALWESLLEGIHVRPGSVAR